MSYVFFPFLMLLVPLSTPLPLWASNCDPEAYAAFSTQKILVKTSFLKNPTKERAGEVIDQLLRRGADPHATALDPDYFKVAGDFESADLFLARFDSDIILRHSWEEALAERKLSRNVLQERRSLIREVLVTKLDESPEAIERKFTPIRLSAADKIIAPNFDGVLTWDEFSQLVQTEFGGISQAIASARYFASPSSQYTENQIIAILQRMASLETPLTMRAIRYGKDPRFKEILASTVTRSNPSTAGFTQTVQNAFGSWETAVRAAGIESQVFRQRNFWTSQNIKAAISALAAAGHSLGSYAIRGSTGTDGDRIVAEAIGESGVTLGSLYVAATKKFSSWQRAVSEAGFQVVRKNIEIRWTREKIIDGIIALDRAGFPLNSSAVKEETGAQAAEILKTALNEPSVNASQLFHAARTHVGSWDAALTESGLFARSIRKEISWTRESIRKSIVELARSGQNLRSHVVRTGNVPEADKLVADTTGYPSGSTSKLYLAARRHYGSWLLALAHAGVRPQFSDLSPLKREQLLRELLSIKVRVNWTRDTIIETLQALQTAGFSLNVAAFNGSDTDRIAQELAFITGVPYVNPSSYYNAVIRAFGSFDGGLIAAGIDPKKVRIRGGDRISEHERRTLASRRKAAGTQVALLRETGIEFNAQNEIERIVVETRTAENSLINRELDQSFNAIFKDLNDREQMLLDGLLDYFASRSEFETGLNFESIAAYLSETVNISANSVEVQRLLFKIAQNEEAKKLLQRLLE